MDGWKEGRREERKEGRKERVKGGEERKGAYKLPVSGIRMALLPQVL